MWFDESREIKLIKLGNNGFVFQCIAEFGCESQTDILQEECAELIQACSKERLIEEIAHVLVLSLVVARIYDINEDDIVNEINKKMNKEERSTMPGIVAVTKYLVDIWRGSKCPDTYEYLFECKNCKYNELCAKLDELSEVVKNDSI